MLSQSTVAIIQATVPTLQEHGEQLTRYFYERMFAHHPEVKNYFNPANQASGRQQQALASAICTYAANIDKLERLGDAVEVIAHKHASLQIKPEHYPIVGEHLLASISEVLGVAATDPIIAAWSQAYTQLAQILSGREQQIYQQAASQPGGWAGFKQFRIVRKVAESSLITSFYLAPADGEALPRFLPGQYITLRVPTANGGTTMRNYSLSDQPGREWLRISVKREASSHRHVPEGYVSTLLHRAKEVGDLLDVAPPCGEFYLDPAEPHERPLVLLAAGVGITPLLSMLLTALATTPEREIGLIHGILNEEVQAFKTTIDALAANHANLRVHYRYSDPPRDPAARGGNSSTGYIDAPLIRSIVSQPNAAYYFCGPQPFMVNTYRTLREWQIPTSQIHFEFFGPRMALEEADADRSPACPHATMDNHAGNAALSGSSA